MLKRFQPSDEALRFMDVLSFVRDNARLFHLIAKIGVLEDSDWLAVLGRIWTTSDNLADALNVIYFESPFAYREGPIPEMMLDEELEAFNALPERLTIYRGCYVDLNQEGLSFSLCRDVAKAFPFYSNYSQPKHQAILITGEVEKANITAFKDPLGEKEIITKRHDSISEVYLP